MGKTKLSYLGVLSAVLILGGVFGGSTYAQNVNKGQIIFAAYDSSSSSGINVKHGDKLDSTKAAQIVQRLKLAGAITFVDTLTSAWITVDGKDTNFTCTKVDTVVKSNAGTIFNLSIRAAVKGSGADSLVGTGTVGLKVVKRPIVANEILDTASFNKWAKGPDSVRYVTGSAVACTSLAYTKLNAFYTENKNKISDLPGVTASTAVWYTGTDNTVYSKRNAAPTDSGTYTVSVDYGTSTNYESTNESGPVVIGNFRIKYASVPANYFETSDQNVTYNYQNKYRFIGPKPIAGVPGVSTIDTVIYTFIGVSGGGMDGLDATVKQVKITSGSTGHYNAAVCTLTVSKDDTGTIQVSATIKGSSGVTARPKFISPANAVSFKITVGRRQLDSVVVYGSPIYKGEVALPEVYFVYGGGPVPLTYDNTPANSDFLVDTSDAALGEYNMVNAGKAYLVVKGNGKFDGQAVGEYRIAPKPIYVSATVSSVRQYDGTTKVDTATSGGGSRLKLFFDTTSSTVGVQGSGDGMLLVEGSKIPEAADKAQDTLKNIRDFIVVANYDSASAGTRRLTATVRLVSNGLVSKNYIFRTGTGDNTKDTNAVTVTKSGGISITKREPLTQFVSGVGGYWGDTTTFSFTIPDTTDKISAGAHYFNNNVRGLLPTTNPVTFKNGMTNPSGSAPVLIYRYTSTPWFDTTITTFPFDTTERPKEAGVYQVFAQIKDGSNIHGSAENTTLATNTYPGYPLGTYTIKEPAKAVITTPPANASFRKGNNATLSVVAKSPNGTAALGYKWIKFNGADKASGGTAVTGASGASYTVSGGDVGDVLYYGVEITNKPGTAIQVNGVDTSAVVSVTVLKAAETLTGFIKINSDKEWTYSGNAIAPSGDDVKVYLVKTVEGVKDTSELSSNYYTLSYARNTNVGVATITAVGRETGDELAYSGAINGTFQITPKELDRSDLTYDATRGYTGVAGLGANVRANPPKTVGTITVRYDGSTTIPVDVGVYNVEVTVEESANISGGVVSMGAYEITKAIPDSTHFVYTIPKGHILGQSEPFGIGAVTVKGTEYGDPAEVRVTYNYMDELPDPMVAGNYTVRVSIEGGDNYEAGEAVLGVYSVGAVSVASGDRVVPGKEKEEIVAIAPIKIVASGFSAGPSPVSKASGKITFFSSKDVKSGAVYIFDAAGNAVAKVAVKSGSGNEIGSWNLKDSKGAAVSEGTYVAKGALVGKDGNREKVSFVFSVVK